ncbi:unnamed protein product, partial [Candidula unifasciata]
ALLLDEDHKALYRRGWFKKKWKKIKNWVKSQAISAAISTGIKTVVAAGGKRDIEDLAEFP